MACSTLKDGEGHGRDSDPPPRVFALEERLRPSTPERLAGRGRPERDDENELDDCISVGEDVK